MHHKPELKATAGSLDEAVRLLEAGADALLVGNRRFAMRLPGDFGLPDIAEAVKAAKGKGAAVDVSVNGIMDNAILPELPDYLAGLASAGVRAIVFGDPAVLAAACAHAPGLALHWSAEMTSTNYATANYWGKQGASRVILARELNLEEVLEIKRRAAMEVEVQVHGMTNMYHSKRHLVESYATHGGVEMDVGRTADGSLYLTEAERPGQRYPIYEDESGTHIMSPDDICMLEDLHELIEPGIDSLKIEGLLKPVSYNETVVRAYRSAIDAYARDPGRYFFDEEWLESIRAIQDPARELTFGFFYKEQVY